MSRADNAYDVAVPFLLLNVPGLEVAAEDNSGGGPMDGGI